MRNKHILINLTEAEYKAIEILAAKDRRKIADFVYLKLIDSLALEIAEALSIKSEKLRKVTPSDIIIKN